MKKESKLMKRKSRSEAIKIHCNGRNKLDVNNFSFGYAKIHFRLKTLGIEKYFKILYKI